VCAPTIYEIANQPLTAGINEIIIHPKKTPPFCIGSINSKHMYSTYCTEHENAGALI